jgi:hypothetical protein
MWARAHNTHPQGGDALRSRAGAQNTHPQGGDALRSRVIECFACGGTRKKSHVCSHCNGTGWVNP